MHSQILKSNRLIHATWYIPNDNLEVAQMSRHHKVINR